jgi:hypothetical protein
LECCFLPLGNNTMLTCMQQSRVISCSTLHSWLLATPQGHIVCSFPPIHRIYNHNKEIFNYDKCLIVKISFFLFLFVSCFPGLIHLMPRSHQTLCHVRDYVKK